MDTRYKVSGTVIIEPVWWKDHPLISVRLDDSILFDSTISSTKEIKFDAMLDKGIHRLSVAFSNKEDSDTDLVNKRDKAVVIKEIEFFGIHSPRFVWAGEYRPIYPPHMQDQPETLKYHNYLGWNGVWYLDFTVPIFTWIHQTEDFGWIYD